MCSASATTYLFNCLPSMTQETFEFLSYSLGSLKAHALQEKVDKMQLKGAMEIISDREPTFYSWLFLVEKASGSWRPVTGIALFTMYVMQTKFPMETVISLLTSIRKGDIMLSDGPRARIFRFQSTLNQDLNFDSL